MTSGLLWDDFGVTLGCRYRQAAAVSPLLTVAAAALPPPPSPPFPVLLPLTPDSTQTDGDYHRPPRFSTMEGANSWTILVDSACETCAKTSILNAANCHLMMKWRGYIIVSKLWRPTIVFRGSWARTRRRHLCGMRELLTTHTRRKDRLRRNRHVRPSSEYQRVQRRRIGGTPGTGPSQDRPTSVMVIAHGGLDNNQCTAMDLKRVRRIVSLCRSLSRTCSCGKRWSTMFQAMTPRLCLQAGRLAGWQAG